ncbi:hypothetical protein EDB84DRAFT_1634935 [Lactarius hengduanensis]|nr:hypothetical protein EDB84DRAFT_1634935 [Lactarius hengduanensis]
MARRLRRRRGDHDEMVRLQRDHGSDGDDNDHGVTTTTVMNYTERGSEYPPDPRFPVRPAKTPTRTRKNPYPQPRVWVFTGTGRGSLKMTRGLPVVIPTQGKPIPVARVPTGKHSYHRYCIASPITSYNSYSLSPPPLRTPPSNQTTDAKLLANSPSAPEDRPTVAVSSSPSQGPPPTAFTPRGMRAPSPPHLPLPPLDLLLMHVFAGHPVVAISIVTVSWHLAPLT